MAIDFTYTGDGSYIKSEIEDRLDSNVNTSLGHIYIYIYIYEIKNTW